MNAIVELWFRRVRGMALEMQRAEVTKHDDLPPAIIACYVGKRKRLFYRRDRSNEYFEAEPVEARKVFAKVTI